MKIRFAQCEAWQVWASAGVRRESRHFDSFDIRLMTRVCLASPNTSCSQRSNTVSHMRVFWDLLQTHLFDFATMSSDEGKQSICNFLYWDSRDQSWKVRIVGINCLWSGNPAVQASEQLLICMPYVNFGVKNCPIDRIRWYPNPELILLKGVSGPSGHTYIADAL